MTTSAMSDKPATAAKAAARQPAALKLKAEGKTDAALVEALRVVEAGLRSGRLTARQVEMVLDVCLAAKLPRVGEMVALAAGDNLLSAKALLRLAQGARRQKKADAVHAYIGQARKKGLAPLAAKAADKLESQMAGG